MERPKTFQCPVKDCNITFTRRYNRDRHVALEHNNVVIVHSCVFCGGIFQNVKALREHRLTHKPETGFQLLSSAHKKKCVIYRKQYSHPVDTFEEAIAKDKSDIYSQLVYELSNRYNMKVSIVYYAEFVKLSAGGGAAGGGAEKEEKGEKETPHEKESENEESEEDDTDTEGEVEQAVDGKGNQEANNESENEESEDDDTESESGEEQTSEGKGSNERRYEVCLRAPSGLISHRGDILRLQETAQTVIQQRIDDFLEEGSGWTLTEILCVNLEIGNCSSVCRSAGTGSCDFLSIKRLGQLSRVKRPQFAQNQCFFEAIAFHFVKSTKKKKLRQFIDSKMRVTIRTPVNIVSIPRFEKVNKHLNLKINVLHSVGKDIYPIYFSKHVTAQNIVNLLLYETENEGKAVSHYTYIANVDKFLAKRYGDGKTTSYCYEKSRRCLNCLSKFTQKSKEKCDKVLQAHYVQCVANKTQSITVPPSGATLKFKHFNRKFQVPHVGFFDFESAHETPKFVCQRCEKKKEDDKTRCIHRSITKALQVPITYSFLIIDNQENVLHKKTYTGYDCVENFLNTLLDIEHELTQCEKKPLVMTEKEKTTFAAALFCHICESDLLGDKVKDHCHRTGKYMGAAHNLCNLQRQEINFIPLFCHNLSGYDSHFLVQKFGLLKEVVNIRALPYNTERFRTITMNSFVFLDSLSFLNAGLGELSTDLVKNEQHKFPILNQMQLYQSKEKKKMMLLLRKGIYPYEHVTSIQQLKTMKKLPKKEAFFSTLTRSHVTEEEYQHAQTVFREFQCKNMVDYTELYCASDVGLLAEVVTSFRKSVLINFGLDCW